VSAYAPLFDDAGKTLTVDLAAGVGLDGDGALLEQMLSNLLENALEHSRDGARVFVSLTVVEGNAILRVGDDGPGISPVDRERLFERFYRSDRSRGSRGNGLGLSLVKAIAELHSATVTVEDGAPGAVFVVRFNSYKTV
jgi:signal transduction histidine kinase